MRQGRCITINQQINQLNKIPMENSRCLLISPPFKLKLPSFGLFNYSYLIKNYLLFVRLLFKPFDNKNINAKSFWELITSICSNFSFLKPVFLSSNTGSGTITTLSGYFEYKFNIACKIRQATKWKQINKILAPRYKKSGVRLELGPARERDQQQWTANSSSIFLSSFAKKV